MAGNPIEEKSFEFAVRIVKLRSHLCGNKNEYVLSQQLLRSGTSVGANVSEAQRAQSPADFLSKMSIALKEANETDYWLRLLYKTEYLTAAEYNSISADTLELIKMLSSICKTTRDAMPKRK